GKFSCFVSKIKVFKLFFPVNEPGNIQLLILRSKSNNFLLRFNLDIVFKKKKNTFANRFGKLILT
ncbi:MAG: hypothetical protein KAX05_03670, partial [Bacteroidales bacterium]|nr:hypothetical protein [Bacteroidales bacterium]